MRAGTRVRTRTRRGSCAREARTERENGDAAFGSTSRVMTADGCVARTFQALLAHFLQEGLPLVRTLLAGH